MARRVVIVKAKGLIRGGSRKLAGKLRRANEKNLTTQHVVTMDGDVVRAIIPGKAGGSKGAVRLERLAGYLDSRKKTSAFWSVRRAEGQGGKSHRDRRGVYKRRPLIRRIRLSRISRAMGRQEHQAIRAEMAGKPNAARLRNRYARTGAKYDRLMVKKYADGKLTFNVAKEQPDVTGRFVTGWFNVVSKDGELVEDLQNDVILMDDMRETAHDYMSEARVAKVMHDGEQIGRVVESVIIDDEFCKFHGIEHTERGWWGTIEVTDENTQERVRKGDLRCFSIGGSGKRIPFSKRHHVSRAHERVRLAKRLASI